MVKFFDLARQYLDVLEVYEKVGKSMLVDVEPGSKVTIKRIEGGEEIKRHLDDLGVMKGEELSVLEQGPKHRHMGAISFSMDGREVVLGHGMADKVYMADKDGVMTSLLEMEKGHHGILKAFGGGKDFVEWLYELGMEVGKEIEFLRHLPNDTLLFDVEGRLVPMGEGQASKILANREGKTIQINFLGIGEKAEVRSIIGGTNFKDKMQETGIREGAEITLSKRESTVPIRERGKYVRVETGDRQVTIGYGMARKIWVD